MALVKSTEWPASTAARPSAMARWVLPTPGGPKTSTFSAWAMKRPVASSRTSFWSIEGWNLKSKSSSVFTAGKWAIWMPMATRLRCLVPSSSAQELVEEVEVGRLLAGRLGEQRVEPLGDVAEAEPGAGASTTRAWTSSLTRTSHARAA